MKNSALSKRYAQALFELGEEYQLTADICDQLNLIAVELEDNADFRQLILGKSLDETQKKELIATVFGKSFHVFTQNFLFLIFDKNREAILPEIIDVFNKFLRQKEGIVTARLITAQPVDETTKKELSAALKKAFNDKNIVFEEEINASLLGGAVIKIEDLMLDGSLKSRIYHMRDELIRN